MKKLWAPWRIEYIRSPKEDGCIFCDKPAGDNEREDLILYRGEKVFILMNLYPYNNAHHMIAPSIHVDYTEELDADTYKEIMVLADQSMAILKETMDAQGFNFGANIGAAAGAGFEEHIHFHIVPRWAGDTNFMPFLGHTKVEVQGLQECYDLLRPHFDCIKIDK